MLKDRVVTVLDGDIQPGTWGLQPGHALIRRGLFGLESLDLSRAALWQETGTPVDTIQPRPASWIDRGPVVIAATLPDGRHLRFSCSWNGAFDLMKARRA